MEVKNRTNKSATMPMRPRRQPPQKGCQPRVSGDGLRLENYMQLSRRYVLPIFMSCMSLLVTAACEANSGASVSGGRRQYYISTRGSDSNDGSAGHPWATITRADSALVLGPQGTTVHVASGTYSLSSHIVTRTSGTASARIRYISDMQWGAKLVSSAPDNIWYNNADYLDIMGFEMSGSASATMNEGIVSHARSHNRYIGNKIHDIAAPCGNSNGGDGIGNGNYGSNPPLQDEQDIGNIIYNIGTANTPGQCQLVHGIYNSAVNGVVYNNLISNVTSFGIETYHSATDQMISNNTIFNTGGGSGGGGIQITARAGEGGVASNDYTTVNNNLIVNTGGYGITEYPTVGTHNVYNNNLVIGSSSGNFHLIYGTMNHNIESGNPSSIFVGYQPNGTGDYRPREGSRAVGAGTNLCASHVQVCVPAEDLGGALRPGIRNASGKPEITSVPSSSRTGSVTSSTSPRALPTIGAYELGSSPAKWPWY